MVIKSAKVQTSIGFTSGNLWELIADNHLVIDHWSLIDHWLPHAIHLNEDLIFSFLYFKVDVILSVYSLCPKYIVTITLGAVEM